MSTSRSGAKLFVAFAVLGVALLLADSFRQDGTRKAHSPFQTAEQIILRETPAPGDVQMIRPEAPTAEIQPALLAPPPDATEYRGWNEDETRLAPPPAMARTFPNPAPERPYAGVAPRGLDSPAGQRTVQRTHAVRDGDTLEDLAQRYLGDRARWREIFQANRDQIGQPDLLPLAAKLVIPPKYPLPPTKPYSEPSERPVVQAPLVRLTP